MQDQFHDVSPVLGFGSGQINEDPGAPGYFFAPGALIDLSMFDSKPRAVGGPDHYFQMARGSAFDEQSTAHGPARRRIAMKEKKDNERSL